MKRLSIIFSFMLILSACIKEGPRGYELQVGDMLPDFEVVMNDYSKVSDDDLSKGVSVIMFFHTSCPDCQQTLPIVQDTYDEYAPKGVSFALISREDVEVDVEFFWKKKGLKMPYSAQEDRSVYEKFAKTRIPRIYISKDGIIRHIFTDDPVPSYDDLKSPLDELTR